MLLAYPMAYFVAFHARRKFVWLIALTIPFWTSYLLRVFAWKVILGFNGVINSGLERLGLIHAPLEFLLYNPFAVGGDAGPCLAAFAILPIYVSLEKIDRALLEAAADLGDGALRRFLRITPAALDARGDRRGDPDLRAHHRRLCHARTGGRARRLHDRQCDRDPVQTRAGNWPLGAALALVSMVLVSAVAGLFVWSARLAVRTAR